MKILNEKEIDTVNGANLNCQEGYYVAEYCSDDQHALPPHRRRCNLECVPISTNSVTTGQFVFLGVVVAFAGLYFCFCKG